jgi:Putative amidoligase enzyme.
MDLREINFGVEIETVKRTRERVARAIQSVVGGEVRHIGRPVSFDPWEVVDDQGRTWKVVSDGSLINVPGHLRAEVVSPVLAYEDIPILQEVIRAVRRCGAKVDRRCGIHIHVDATPFDGRTLANLAKIIYKQEALILTALGVNENRQNNYSKPVSDEFIRKIERRRPKNQGPAQPHLVRLPQPPAATLRLDPLLRGEPAQRLVPGHR